MMNYVKATYSVQEVNEILCLAMELQGINEEIIVPEEKGFSLNEIVESGTSIGLSFKNIEKAIKAYHSSKIIRHSHITDTHVFEEREIVTTARWDEIWHEIISELQFRMSGIPTIESRKKVNNEWVFTERNGVETEVSLNQQETGIKLIMARQIGFASPFIESVLAGSLLSIIIVSYLLIFLKTAFSISLITLLSLMILSTLLIRKINVSRRNRKIKIFNRLVEQVIDQIPLIETKERQTAESTHNDDAPDTHSAAKNQQDITIRDPSPKRFPRF
ncbi:MAG: hypothetical protein WD022_05185 [Balneolaceae bacterium]